MDKIRNYLATHFVHQDKLWWHLMATNLFVFGYATIALISGYTLAAFFAVPTAWGVGYLLGSSYTANRIYDAIRDDTVTGLNPLTRKW